MKPRIQFSARNALIVTAWTAIYFAYAVHCWNTRHSIGGLIHDSLGEILLVAPPAAIVGALAGRPWLGFLCGLASGLASIAYLLLGTYEYYF